MNTDTIWLLIITVATLAVIIETLREAFHDGPSPQGPPRSHHEDTRFQPPHVRA
jgi:hypothetical protein